MTNRKPTQRRGVVLLIGILLLSLVELLAITQIGSGEDDMRLAVQRVTTTRALYAAESAGLATLKLLRANVTTPAVNSTLPMSASTATYLSIPALGTSGTISVQGVAGDSTRRVNIAIVNN